MISLEQNFLGIEVLEGYLSGSSLFKVLSPKTQSQPLSQSRSSDIAGEEGTSVALRYGLPGVGENGEVSYSGRVPRLVRQLEGLGAVAFDLGLATSSLGLVGVKIDPKPSE